jgi:orotidine-5'-phosphate decarboxylase
VQKQYHGGTLKISEWSDIVNAAILAGPGIIEALDQVIASEPSFQKEGPRGLLILAEMTSKGSLATGEYTKVSVDTARRYKKSVMGFVAMRTFNDLETETKAEEDEDFVVFTTGVNLGSKGDNLGQQYNTPESAVARGADLLIVGRGIYKAADPFQAAKRYQKEGWEAYLKRTGQ